MATYTPRAKAKPKFKTDATGKRAFPPQWYAAQAARRKKKPDGSYKAGKFKESRTSEATKKLPSAEKARVKRKMPESWYKKQAEARAKRKAAKEAGATQKTRGKRRDYKEKDIDKSLKEGRRKINTDTYESASYAVRNLRKGNKCEISSKGAKVEITIKGDGFYPLTRVGFSKSGEMHIVDTNNITASWVL